MRCVVQEEQLGQSSFGHIRSLDLSGLRIRDTGAVFACGTPFAGLQELNLNDNLVVDVAMLAGLTTLSVLKLNNNRLGDAEGCAAGFAEHINSMLEQRDVASNAASTSDGVGGAKPVSGISRSQAPAAPLSPRGVPVPLFPNLQVLQIGGNGIVYLAPLQLGCMTALRSLFLQDNEVHRIEGLDGLVHLRELVLDNNKIR